MSSRSSRNEVIRCLFGSWMFIAGFT